MFIAFVLSMFMLLTGALAVVSVEPAEADTVELGPDGYFSTLSEGATPVKTGGWSSTRRIVFGKQGNVTYPDDIPASIKGSAVSVSGGYKPLAKGNIGSETGKTFLESNSSFPGESSSTSVAADETLLWADDVVTANIQFDTNYPNQHSFDSEDGPYKSNLALVSDAVGSWNYSSFEQGLLRSARVEGVCTAAHSSACDSGSEPLTNPVGSFSVNAYKVFPLSIGDVDRYFGHTSIDTSGDNLRCKTHVDAGNVGGCANSTSGTWLRSPFWWSGWYALAAWGYGNPEGAGTEHNDLFGFRPALRLKLDTLLLSADSGNQGQSAVGDLRLTFVDAAAGSLTGASATARNTGLVLQGTHGSLTDGLGFKIVDPDNSTEVVASGLTQSGVVDAASLQAQGVVSGKAYDVYWWGQENGSATEGWSNRATVPSTTQLTFDFLSFGISLTGQTQGELKAYKIGEYGETMFDQTGALRSVRLDTPEGLGTVLKTTAGTAGGSDVDTGNPIGWVASQWLGYPTDPLSDDVTSACSPYAGKLQLLAQELAKDTGVLGAAAGSLPKLDGGPETLKVSGPGLYLIVDSSQDSGGSLPIIVGTKVFNDALGDDGGFVDFADAGVKGKPRLGQASLKTTVTDIAKRIVNDAGMDGFDVGTEVEYEVTLRVPDLSGFTVDYDSYEFNVADEAASGLTLPADGSGVEVFVDALSPTEPQTLPSSSITVAGDTLSVSGLKALFVNDNDTNPVTGKTGEVPVGSLIRLRYTAVLNTSAAVSAPVEGDSLKPNVNTVTLTRSYTGSATAGWTDNSDGTESRSAVANAYTFKLDVVKLDKDDPSKRLGGAEFEVSRAKHEGGSETLEFVGSDGVYRLAVAGETGSSVTVVTKADGTLSLLGVEARELSFKETNAPSGYFKVSDFGVDIRPVWNEDATQVTKVTYATSGTNLAYVSQSGKQVMVLDPAWSLANLPYTGGMGILILLVVGGLMLVFAVRPYVLSRRAERDANLV